MPQTPGSRFGRQAPSEEDVLRCWDALTLEQRQQAMRFHDPVLVERIWDASQGLLQQQFLQAQVMQHLGISLPGLAHGVDPFLSSELLNQAFEFSWLAQRNAQHPCIVVLDSNRPPAMALKADFICRPDFLDVLREALPDLLCARTGRVPLPRARWKEIWLFEPSSVAQMKAQLAKLVEQALWVVPTDFPNPGDVTDGLLELTAEAQAPDSKVAFEPWMAQDSDSKVAETKKKKNAKTKKKKAKTLDKVDEKSPKMIREDFLREVELEVAEDTSLPTDEQDDRSGSADAEDEPCCAASGRYATSDAEEAQLQAQVNDTAIQFDDEVLMDQRHPAGPARDATPVCEDSIDEGKSLIHGERFILPPQTPLASPESSSRHWHPRQLVCYIWNQTSQLLAPDEPESPASLTSPITSSAQPRTPASRPAENWLPQSPTSPTSRGSWCRPDKNQLSNYGLSPSRREKVIVKNTFIDIEDDVTECSTTNTRSARSLSPSYRTSCCDEWTQDEWTSQRL